MLKPLFARVVLKRDDLKTRSNLVVPKLYAKRNAPSRGVVVAKGPAASAEVEIGGTYIFGQHAGVWINPDGTVVAADETAELYLCQDEDLLVKVE